MRTSRAVALWSSVVALGMGSARAISAQGSPSVPAASSHGVSDSGSLRFLVQAADSGALAHPVDPTQVPALQRAIALDLHGVTRDHALVEIGRASGVGIVYASDVVPRSGSVDLVGPAISVQNALQTVLAGLGLDALVGTNGTLVITSRVAADASLRVQVADSASRSPLEDVLLSLVASNGTVVVQSLTDRLGTGVLTTPTGGEYRVRVRRMGYSPFTSRPVALRIGDTAHLVLSVPSMPVTLPTVETGTKPKTCGRSQAGQLASLELWDQVQTALMTSELTNADTSVHTLRRLFSRLVAPTGMVDELLSGSQLLGRERPYATRSPADLSAQGYITTDAGGEATFAAPDAPALLSSQFENDHCFGMVGGAGPTAGLVGLSFTPVSDRVVADIQGTIWVTQKTAELEYIEFRYVNNDWPGMDGAGGRVTFERLPTGRWIVHEWFIRASRADGSTAEVGGAAEAVAVGPAPSPPAGPTGGGPVQGSLTCPATAVPLTVAVTDTLTDQGLPGAIVEVDRFASPLAGGERRVLGTPEVASTDSDGTASLCISRGNGDLGVVAYLSRATSVVALVTLGADPPDTVWLGLDGRRVGHVPPAPLDADERTARLDVVARDTRGTPLEGVAIEVTRQPTSGLTNNSGRLSVRELSGGLAIVDVWRPGYVRQRLAVDLAPDATRTIEIRMVADGSRPGG